ncbi:transglycosylase domain-containing protein [Actinomadura scrupuli]|uniref:transglycosylase domain-containing protein n=1 Tax=Actinomadura scrupuli TaxID=559629 RepID=UPI003D95332B
MPNWKIVLGVFVLGFASIGVMIGVAYANTPVPTDAQTEATKQQSSIYYADGKTPIARIGTPRVNVEYDAVPAHVRNAVLAIEDHNFEHEAGISPTGLARALWSTASGAQTQGGSTITQQMARNYYSGLSQERSINRKMKEILISVRLGNDKDKKYILKTYLNTVYLGRQAYGIEAASQAYFRKHVGQLSVSEGAMLAAMIQRPNYFHTTGNDQNFQDLKTRWTITLDNMVKYGWLSEADRAKITTFPKTAKEWSDVSDNDQSGQNGYLKQRVLKELTKLGIRDEELGTGGYKIVTTFKAPLQKYSADLVKQIKKERHLGKDIHFGLAAVDPATGEVWAAYGGPGYEHQQFDDSYQAQIQPGSSFKPYVLATALEQGYGLKSLVNGNSPQTIQGVKFTNDSNGEQGVFDFVKMTAQSINTAYVWLGTKVGLDNVIKTAVASGIPKESVGMNTTVLSLPLGPNLVRPIDQAAGYATFANDGTHIETHVVKSILGPDNGKPFVKAVKIRKWKKTVAFSPDVARDATYAMRAVVTSGTGKRAALPSGRPVAGKTGTTSFNKSAWFSGYAPQLSTSVAMWRQTKKGLGSLQGVGGYSQIYGGTIPAETFSRFMTKALEGKEIKQFEPPAYGGTTQKWATPKATPTPTLTPTPNNTPTCNPGQGGFGGFGQNGRPCASNSPSVPANGQPCNRFNLPVGCDPNKPPSTPPPNWWCDDYKNSHGGQVYPGCPTGGPGSGPGSNGRTQTVTLARIED